MSANLLDGITPTLVSGTTENDGIWHNAGTSTDGHVDWLMWDLAGQPTLATNQTYHVGLSVKGATAHSGHLCPTIGYKDAAGRQNWVNSHALAIGTSWGRVEGAIVVPSGMRPFAFYVAAYGTCPETWMASPTLSYGSPVTLASDAHTPYATQDHLAAEYATKAALKVTSDAVTAEVTERGKLAGRVGTLEGTTDTHTSKLQQLAASITSLVRGESTYTDPDGRSATSGIYSLVTQTRDSVTALFGSYTKTADLASTQAVRDARKAGTDAQAAASAAQSTANSAKSTAQAAASDAATAKTNAASAVSTANSASTIAANAVKTANAASSTASSASSNASAAVSTANAAKTSAASAVSTANAASSTAGAAKTTADSLATLIRADATGITVGKSADGKTWSTGRTRMTDKAFQVLDKAGAVIAQLAGDGVSLLAGLVRLQARKEGPNNIAIMSSDFLGLNSLWQAVMRAGKETGGAYVEGYAAAIAEVTGKRGTTRLYCTGGDGSTITANNAFTLAPDGYDLSQPEYLTAALLGTGGGGTGVTHFQDAVTMASDLDACGPGVFSYNASTAARPTDYGTCVCIRAGDGMTSTWLFEFALPTMGDPYWRRNINGNGWTSWWVIKSQ